MNDILPMIVAIPVALAGLALAIGLIFGIPMIWFHVGHVSRKLSRVIELLEQKKEES
jgi:hypothetical protein